MKRRIRLDPDHAAQVLAELSPPTRRKLRDAMRTLGDDPLAHASGLDVKELKTPESGPRAFRLRVGDWRVVYLLREREIQVLRIFHRRDGYGWMERLDSA